MSPGNVDDMNAPKSMNNIVLEVMDYVQGKIDDSQREKEWKQPEIESWQFKVYDEALQVLWPELHKASPEAHLRVAVSIYVEVSERWKFEHMVPRELKGLVL